METKWKNRLHNKQKEKWLAAGVSRLNVTIFSAEQMEKILSETTCPYLNIHQFCVTVNIHTESQNNICLILCDTEQCSKQNCNTSCCPTRALHDNTLKRSFTETLINVT
jgi:hypothetical protein